jgi:hypothetical protein
MPFEYVLAELIAQNEGAVGAVFLDDNGEAVDLACSELRPHEMRVLGAYVGIYLRQFEKFLEPGGHGRIELLHIENEGLHVFARPLPEGYYVVLCQRSPALSFRARRSLEQASATLSREVFEAH